jgi:Ca2+-binding EF-hand superfamily protein
MKHYLIAAAVAGMSAGVAGAGGNDSKAAWSTLDNDSDGVITRSEAQGSAALSEKFDQYDVNRDGVLSKKEFDASQVSLKESTPAPSKSTAPTGGHY